MQLPRLAIAPVQIESNLAILTAEQYHYLHRVLRLHPGDHLIVMDGLGNSWVAQLQDSSVQILERLEVKTELPIAVTLILALPKGNGFDEVVRATTELGATKIVPAISDRTLLNPSSQKLIRWKKIAQEAAEQSEREIVTEISDSIPFKQALAQTNAAAKYICVARGDRPHLLNCLLSGKVEDTAVAIGCEGGWTLAEVEMARSYGFIPVSLGSRILRAITSPIAAMSLIAASIELRSD